MGRVQRIVSVEDAERGSAGLGGLGRNGEIGGEEVDKNGRVRVMESGGGGGTFTGRRYGDFRMEAPDEPEEANLSLADYVVVKKGKKVKGKKSGQDESVEDGASENVSAAKTETTTCPVCGEFEGDEAAVAHHVNGHFD